MGSLAVAQDHSDTISQSAGRLEPSGLDTQNVKSMIGEALAALDSGRVVKTRRYLVRMQQYADSLNFEYGKEQALYGLGNLYLVQQKYDSAETVLKQAEALNPGPSLSSKVYSLLATSHRYQGDNRRAIEIYQEILARIDTAGDPRTTAGMKQNLADAYMNLGNFGKAFKNYHKAVEYGEAADDTLFLATLLNNVGNAYNGRERYEEAEQYLKRSLSISRDIGFKPGEMRSLVNLGITRSGQSKFAEAESLYVQALSLSEQIRPDTPPIQIQYNMGELYNRMDMPEQAETYFRKSLDNSKQFGITQGRYYNNTGLGNVAESRDRIGEAVSWFRQALAAARELDNPKMLQSSHQKLYELYKKQGAFEAALNHLETSKTLSDSLNAQKRERMLAEYQTRMEVQRKDQRAQTLQAQSDRQQAQLQLQRGMLLLGVLAVVIIGIFALLLYRANREKKVANQKLEEQKRELEEINELKNKLFGVVAHDLRTPLSALVGMLELFRDPSLTEEEMRMLSSELELSLQQNVSIMENLLAWAKGQMSGLSVDPKTLDARRITGEIVDAHKFNAQHKQVTLNNKLPENLKVKGDYNLFKLVMRNLISNGIKFSEEGDDITISGTRQNGEVLFEVKDTGIGIPEAMQDHIFGELNQSRRGTKDERGSGLGLSLCKEFIQKQGGTIRFESTEGEGTTFFFTLPAGEGDR